MDNTQKVIDSIILIKDHESDGLGQCWCSHCDQARQIIADNPKEAESVKKLIKNS